MTYPLRNKCEEKAKRHNIPHFTLLACDNFTVQLVSLWISYAKKYGVPDAKIQEAEELRAHIEQWRKENPTLCKVPD